MDREAWWATLPTHSSIFGLPCGSAGKESACVMGDLGSMPELERSPGEGNSYPHQYSGLENSVDCIVHEVAKSRTRPSDFRSLVAAPRPWSTHSTAAAHRRRSPEACGILPDHGSNLCPPHWQVTSVALSHQDSPQHLLSRFFCIVALSYLILLNNAQLCAWSTFYLSVHQLTDVWLVSALCLCEQRCYERLSTGFCLDECSQLSWAYG